MQGGIYSEIGFRSKMKKKWNACFQKLCASKIYFKASLNRVLQSDENLYIF